MTDKELIDVTEITALDIFETTGGVDTVLAMVKAAVAEFEPDVSTREGRSDIAALALRVAKSKTWLDAQGKLLVDPIKEKSNTIDARRKVIWDALVALKAEVRKPLTKWEAVEEDRVAGYVERIKEITEWGDDALLDWDTCSPSDMANTLVRLEQLVFIEETWEEFAEQAEFAITQSIEKHKTAIGKRETFDEERAESLRLREEEQKHMETGRREAEEKRVAERDERIKADAEAATKRAEAEADERVKAADARAAHAKENAEREARERVEADQRRKDQAERDRAADEDHREQINSMAIAVFVGIGLGEDVAVNVIAAIARGDIPNVKITY